MRAGAAIALPLAAAAILVAARAGAVERENQLGLDLGASTLVIQKKGAATGPGGGLHYTYGLSDAFNLVSDASWSALVTGVSRAATLGGASVGLAYVLDVLRWVPWGSLEVGADVLTGQALGGTSVSPTASLAVGLDYRFNRSWAAGLTLRETSILPQLPTYPVLMQAFARLGYTWGW